MIQHFSHWVHGCLCLFHFFKVVSADIFKGTHPSTVSSTLPFLLFSRFPAPSPGCGRAPHLHQVSLNKQRCPLHGYCEGRGDPCTTGSDGISSISCIPPCCCANTACPTGLGRIGGSQPVYPSSTWQPLRESRALGHMESRASMGRTATKACLFSTSSLSASCLLSLVFPCREQIHAGISTNGRPIKYHQDCLLYSSVR